MPLLCLCFCLSIKTMKTKDIVWLWHEVAWYYRICLFHCWTGTTADKNLWGRNVHRWGNVLKLHLPYFKSRLQTSFLPLWLVLTLELMSRQNEIKPQISLRMNNVGNIWNNVKPQLNQSYIKDLEIFRHFIWKSFVLLVGVTIYKCHSATLWAPETKLNSPS